MSLASRLTDEDLGAMLNCIYAKGQLKRLNLTYCFQIVGHGLEPLRGSTVLEKVDLGLVRQYELPQAVDDARLSDEVVYEIFNDIVEGGSFERLQLPLAWSWYYVYNRERLTQFVDRHNLAFLVEDNLCAHFGFTEVSLIEHLTSKKNTDLIDECIGCFRTSEFRGCTHCNEIACIHCDEHVYAFDDCAMVSCDSCRNDVCIIAMRKAIIVNPNVDNVDIMVVAMEQLTVITANQLYLIVFWKSGTKSKRRLNKRAKSAVNNKQRLNNCALNLVSYVQGKRNKSCLI